MMNEDAMEIIEYDIEYPEQNIEPIPDPFLKMFSELEDDVLTGKSLSDIEKVYYKYRYVLISCYFFLGSGEEAQRKLITGNTRSLISVIKKNLHEFSKFICENLYIVIACSLPSVYLSGYYIKNHTENLKIYESWFQNPHNIFHLFKHYGKVYVDGIYDTSKMLHICGYFSEYPERLVNYSDWLDCYLVGHKRYYTIDGVDSYKQMFILIEKICRRILTGRLLSFSEDGKSVEIPVKKTYSWENYKLQPSLSYVDLKT